MRVELRLWNDQCGIGENIKTSCWQLYVNGEELCPNKILDLETAHRIVLKLLEIEDLVEI